MERELLSKLVFNQMLLDMTDNDDSRLSVIVCDTLAITINMIEVFLDAEKGIFNSVRDVPEWGSAFPILPDAFVEKWCADINGIIDKFGSISEDFDFNFDIDDFEQELRTVADNYIDFCIKIHTFIINNPDKNYEVNIIGSGDVREYTGPPQTSQTYVD